jgi:hypothetical protein
MPAHPKGSNSPTQHRVGEHWSGNNPVPTIGRFIERLQADQQDREAHQKASASKRHDEQKDENAVPHRPQKVGKGRTREVTDPTTGREIEVEDLDESAMEPVKDPKVMYCSSH